jgi:hypothetical protein
MRLLPVAKRHVDQVVDVHVRAHAMVLNQATYRIQEELEAWDGRRVEALSGQDAEIHDGLDVAFFHVSGDVLGRSGAWEMSVPG